jgi:ABC-2 type transport system permease protein
MSGKTWHVARYEYARRVLRPSFLFILLSLPLAVALFAAIVVLAERLSASDLPMGYVDRAGVLPVQAPLPATVAAGGRSPGESNAGQLVPLVAYGTEHAARAALDAGEVQAYFVIADDYRQTDRVALVYADPPSDEAVRQFRDFLQRSLLHDLPPAVAARAVTGSHLMVETPDGARTLSPERLLDTLLPFFVGMAIMMLFFLNAN